MAHAYAPGLGWWAVTADDRVVGNVLLKPDAATGHLEIGWHFAHGEQGRGYATEAGRALLTHAFETLRAPRVVATIVPDNLASRRVAEKLGMHREGTTTKAELLHDVWTLEANGA